MPFAEQIARQHLVHLLAGRYVSCEVEVVIVSWIAQNEITLHTEHENELEGLQAHSIRIYKHPRNGSRLSKNHYYVRYESSITYSTGPYLFPDNLILENLCLIFNKLDYVFWGTFKTEIAPLHFMQNLLSKHEGIRHFHYIEAGEDVVRVCQ